MSHMAASFLGHFHLKPHGDNLLTSSGAFWLRSAQVLVFLMAVSEAIAWGYLGYLFGDGLTRWVGATITGTIIFLVVWMIDASLITMDRAWREHSAALLGQTFADTDRRAVQTFFTFSVRVGLLLGSLYITAPYLAQVVFHRDIQRLIDQTAVTNLATARATVARPFDEREAKLSKDREQTTADFQREVAGAGLSGRYGLGPAAKVMQERIATQTEELGRLDAERKQAAAAFDQLAADWRSNRDTIAASYNVELPQTSILANRQALEELRKRPENQATELAIKAFLAFIFAGLFLLKLFEPNSIRLYMSEVLQQEYVRYRAGTFDDRLPPTERSHVSPTPMTPQRLYQFLQNVWVPLIRTEYMEAESHAKARATQRNLHDMEQLKTQIESAVKEAAQQYEEVVVKAEEARKRVVQLRAAMEIVRGDIESYNRQLEKWAKDEGRGGSVDDDARFERATLKSRIRQKLVEAHRKFEELREQQPTELGRLDRLENELQRCEARLRTQEKELADLAKQMMEVRRGSPQHGMGEAMVEPRERPFHPRPVDALAQIESSTSTGLARHPEPDIKQD